MKYSQSAGIIAGVFLIGICYLPWSFVAAENITVYGMNAAGTDFGRPGLLNIIFNFIIITFFFIPKVWAKRINVFVAGLNMAWSIRNYFLVTTCMMGDCPQKKSGIYLLLILSLIVLLMTLFPKMEITEEK